ncbi:MAG: N(4)-(beta-N-acetylglucosaminyl)-L-asparaginase [Thiotrichales bacterium]|nr:N(4)-(beta-N-acetylglucosaminyl)-L-asparaginase [Thiotrichales bacterium]
MAHARAADTAMILVTNNEGWSGVSCTAQALATGERAMDAIEAGIRLVEADERVRTVGRGGWPNILGEVELDAAIMDGDTRRTGAVGALKGFAHPISIARAVLERLPHELLAGDGAARFARDIGAERSENLTEDSAAAWRRWVDANVSGEARHRWPEGPLEAHCRRAVDPERGRDTTVFLALDANGSIASGVSTSGWAWKHPGRLGDSPVIGAGSYADSRHGAAACTGAGEMAIRCATARSVVLCMRMGMSVEEAVNEAARDLATLEGGLVSRVTVHAIDAAGEHAVAAVNAEAPLHHWLWRGGDTVPSQHPVREVGSGLL